MWLAVQAVFAVFAWGVAIRAVLRVADLAGVLIESKLVETTRALTKQGDHDGLRRLGQALDSANLQAIVAVSESELLELDLRVNAAVDAVRPPLGALRGMATIGTSLGLLAVIVRLHHGLQIGSAGAAMMGVLDSAVLGFVTALPLWTAIGLVQPKMRRIVERLDALAEARLSMGEAQAG